MAEKLNAKELYDISKLLVKKVEQEVADGKKVDQDILDQLREAYEKIVEFEKMYLIRCQDRLWGAILMELNVEIDFTQKGPTDIKIHTEPVTLGINPLHCADYTFPEFTGAIVAEISKMVCDHPEDFARLNSEKDLEKHKLLEKASDASVYSMIQGDVRLRPNPGMVNSKLSEKGLRLPPDAYTVSNVSKDTRTFSQERMPLKYYFDTLYKNRDSKSASNSSDGGHACSSNPNGISTKNNNDGKDCHDWEDSEDDNVKGKIQAVVRNAVNSLDERSRGYISSSVMSAINALLEPPQISWQQVLAKMVGAVPVPYRKTRMRLNKKHPYRPDLYGRLPKRTVNIICCFDTSGSMSDDDLKYCLNEVFNIIKVYEGSKVTIVECDADVQRVYEARRMSDVKTKMAGRGGTSYTPVINYINGEGEFKNNKNYPMAGKYNDALMVYFTDGYGDTEIPRPRTARNLWVVLNDSKNLSVKEPYGEVTSISTDKKWKNR